MKIFYTGFNLYGQFTKCTDMIVRSFTQTLYEGISNFELSHSFNVSLKEGAIILNGLIDGKTHQERSIPIMNFSDVACADEKILFLNVDGKVHKIDLVQNKELKSTPLSNLLIDVKDKFVKVSCGKKISVAVTKEGKVFNLPNKLKFNNTNIVDIRTGCEHCLLLDNDGNIYSFGRGSRGQLGHGDLEDQSEPKLIAALAGIKIAEIACGGWHSCAVSAEGDLYIWGWNGNGQLGLNTQENKSVSVMATPHVVDFSDSPENSNVVKVACGNRHTIVLLDDEKLYGTGWNKYHQLGYIQENGDSIYKMNVLYDFKGFEVLNLKCGSWSSVVIVQ